MPVYFIRAGETGPVKIGWTTDLEKRRKTLQTNHYEPLRIIRTIEGRRETELWLHDRFAAQRLEGEWFRFHADMAVIEPPEFGPPTPKQPKKARPQKKAVSWDGCWIGNLCQECRDDPDPSAWWKTAVPTPWQRREMERLRCESVA